MQDLVLMILLAVVFIYMIMVAQFQSLLGPFIVMLTMPLAFTGGLGALWIAGCPSRSSPCWASSSWRALW